MSASLSPAGQPVPVAQPVIPPQTPMYNSSTGFPVQEPKAEPNSYLEYLNRKHNIAPDSQRPLVHYDDDNCGFGLPQTTIPRYS